MKTKYILIVIILALSGLAIATNPNEVQHRDAIKNSVKNALIQALNQQGVKKNSIIYKNSTGQYFDNFIWNTVNTSINRNNYLIFSTTNIEVNQKEYTAGIGIFGKVIIFPQIEKMATDKINQLINDAGGLRSILDI